MPYKKQINGIDLFDEYACFLKLFFYSIIFFYIEQSKPNNQYYFPTWQICNVAINDLKQNSLRL